MNNIDNLKDYFNDLPEVKRIKELEAYIDNNEKINKSFNSLKDIQKKMVSSKEFNQQNQYQIYLNEYNQKKEELLNMPFVEEYLELIEIVGQKLNNLSNLIENELYKKING